MRRFQIFIASVALSALAAGQDIIITKAASRVAEQSPSVNFTGAVSVERPFEGTEGFGPSTGWVRFAAGARTDWHTHPKGQILLVTDGTGRVQQWGGPIQEIGKGDRVQIPPGVKHWHGASPSAAMSHLAFADQLDGKAVEWMEEVSDADFNAPLASKPDPAGTSGPSRAQQLVGDVAPKLAELTDKVLFGDVWARPQLSPRDRSLITVSTLIAMNRPDQLRSHLALAKQNGVTEEELGEVITHLAFYAGWPSAITAATVAKEVFRKLLGPFAGLRQRPSFVNESEPSFHFPSTLTNTSVTVKGLLTSLPPTTASSRILLSMIAVSPMICTEVSWISACL